MIVKYNILGISDNETLKKNWHLPTCVAVVIKWDFLNYFLTFLVWIITGLMVVETGGYSRVYLACNCTL